MQAIHIGNINKQRLYYIVDGAGDADLLLLSPSGSSRKTSFLSFVSKTPDIKILDNTKFLQFLWHGSETKDADLWSNVFVNKTMQPPKDLILGSAVVTEFPNRNADKVKSLANTAMAFRSSLQTGFMEKALGRRIGNSSREAVGRATRGVRRFVRDAAYDAEAIDADNDGWVQEGTQFARRAVVSAAQNVGNVERGIGRGLASLSGTRKRLDQITEQEIIDKVIEAIVGSGLPVGPREKAKLQQLFRAQLQEESFAQNLKRFAEFYDDGMSWSTALKMWDSAYKLVEDAFNGGKKIETYQQAVDVFKKTFTQEGHLVDFLNLHKAGRGGPTDVFQHSFGKPFNPEEKLSTLHKDLLYAVLGAAIREPDLKNDVMFIISEKFLDNFPTPAEKAYALSLLSPAESFGQDWETFAIVPNAGGHALSIPRGRVRGGVPELRDNSFIQHIGYRTFDLSSGTLLKGMHDEMKAIVDAALFGIKFRGDLEELDLDFKRLMGALQVAGSGHGVAESMLFPSLLNELSSITDDELKKLIGKTFDGRNRRDIVRALANLFLEIAQRHVAHHEIAGHMVHNRKAMRDGAELAGFTSLTQAVMDFGKDLHKVVLAGLTDDSRRRIIRANHAATVFSDIRSGEMRGIYRTLEKISDIDISNKDVKRFITMSDGDRATVIAAIEDKIKAADQAQNAIAVLRETAVLKEMKKAMAQASLYKEYLDYVAHIRSMTFTDGDGKTLTVSKDLADILNDRKLSKNTIYNKLQKFSQQKIKEGDPLTPIEILSLIMPVHTAATENGLGEEMMVRPAPLPFWKFMSLKAAGVQHSYLPNDGPQLAVKPVQNPVDNETFMVIMHPLLTEGAIMLPQLPGMPAEGVADSHFLSPFGLSQLTEMDLAKTKTANKSTDPVLKELNHAAFTKQDMNNIMLALTQFGAGIHNDQIRRQLGSADVPDIPADLPDDPNEWASAIADQKEQLKRVTFDISDSRIRADRGVTSLDDDTLDRQDKLSRAAFAGGSIDEAEMAAYQSSYLKNWGKNVTIQEAGVAATGQGGPLMLGYRIELLKQIGSQDKLSENERALIQSAVSRLVRGSTVAYAAHKYPIRGLSYGYYMRNTDISELMAEMSSANLEGVKFGNPANPFSSTEIDALKKLLAWQLGDASMNMRFWGE